MLAFLSGASDANTEVGRQQASTLDRIATDIPN